MLRLVAALVALPLLAASAAAGTPEAPEVADPAGDCAFASGNEHLDVVAVWISNEDADSFDVNVQVAKWTEAVAVGSGFTVQFSHQGMQFGIVGALTNEGWEYGNALYDGQEVRDWREAAGAFAAPVLTVSFAKGIFPHGDASDNRLTGFFGGSADLKPHFPLFVSPVPSPVMPDYLICDTFESTAEYEFAVGQHGAHATMEDNATATPDADVDAAAEPTGGFTEVEAPAETNDAPLGALVAVAAVAVAVALRRR